MASLQLAFDILAKDNASKVFDKVGDSAETAGDRGKKFGLLLGGAAVAGAAGLFTILKGGAAEFSDNQTAMAQFEAGLKSTGNVAGITAGEMKSLSDSIEAKTGTDGASVVAGGALLATFTKVRNEVGQGNDVFSRATQAGVDLAAKGFGSVESNAVLLGKALNDPVKGLAALGKQGVTFTEDQKKTIAALVETGDTLGAQKIILAEIEGQVGGSAAAYGQTLPGQLARAKAAFDGVKETIFTAVLPAVAGLLEFVSNRLIPGFQSLAEKVGPTFATIGDVLQNVVIPALMTAGQAIAGFISAIPLPVLVGIGAAVVVFGGAMLIAAAATAIQTAAMGALNAVLLLNPIGIIVALLVGLVAGLVFAYRESETFRDIVDGAFSKVKEAAQAVADFVTEKIPAAFQAVKDKVTGFVTGTRDAVTGAWDAVKSKTTEAFEAVKTFVSEAWEAVKTSVSTAVTNVKDAVTTGFGAVITYVTEFPGNVIRGFGVIGQMLFDFFVAAWDRIDDAIEQGTQAVLTFVGGIPGKILTGLGVLGDLLYSAGGDLLRGLANGIGDAIGGVVRKAKEAAAAVVNAVKGAFGINSPSRVMMGLGSNVSQGLAIGIERDAGLAQNALTDLTSGLTSSSFDTSGMGGGSVSDLLREQNELLRRMPRDYRLGERQMAGAV